MDVPVCDWIGDDCVRSERLGALASHTMFMYVRKYVCIM